MDKEVNDRSRRSNPFNSTIETGLRTIVILAEFAPTKLDVQNLINLDYLAVHSQDINSDLKSLHGNNPNRTGELLVRRDLVAKGLDLMISRGLVTKFFNSNKGIRYGVTENAVLFLKYFESNYYKELSLRAKWLRKYFKNVEDDEISNFVNQNMEKWGVEFSPAFNFGVSLDE